LQAKALVQIVRNMCSTSCAIIHGSYHYRTGTDVDTRENNKFKKKNSNHSYLL